MNAMIGPAAVRDWVPPSPCRKRISLSSGTATLAYTHKWDTVEFKVRAFGCVVRDKKGNPKRDKFPVKSTHVTLRLADGSTYKARSCTKPPDVFDARTGIWIATLHLVKIAELSKEDKEGIIKSMIHFKPKRS